MAAGISSADLVPFRWPASWTDPRHVALFEGGPVNCLVFDGAAGPIAEAATMAGLSVIYASSLAAAPLAEIKWNTSVPIIAVTGLVWPRMKTAASGGPNQAQTGPTGAPWIDSSSWVARHVLSALATPAARDRPASRPGDRPSRAGGRGVGDGDSIGDLRGRRLFLRRLECEPDLLGRGARHGEPRHPGIRVDPGRAGGPGLRLVGAARRRHLHPWPDQALDGDDRHRGVPLGLRERGRAQRVPVDHRHARLRAASAMAPPRREYEAVDRAAFEQRHVPADRSSVRASEKAQDQRM